MMIAQCTRCNDKKEIDQRPTQTMRCNCGGIMSIYTSSTLSPEELAKYGPAKQNGDRPIGVVDKPSTRITNQDGELTKPPVMIHPKKREENNDMTRIAVKDGVPVLPTPDKAELIKLVASGKTLAKVQKLWGLNTTVMYKHLGEWGLKGLKTERAQQLLDEMKIDGKIAQSPDENAVLRGLVAKLEQEIEDMKSSPWPADPDVNKLREDLAKKDEALAGATVIANQAGAELSVLRTMLEGYERTNKILNERVYELTNTQLIPQSPRKFGVTISGPARAVAFELVSLGNYVDGHSGQFQLSVELSEVAAG